ncbi:MULTISPECIES: YitT family protein [Bacillus]|uniref:YitT family protein n=1 Tax=Bacillus TaxID=1386 RepID=UPI000469E6C1|nr:MULTISPECIES: YitT family protein [Bacillus]MED1410443.1 YitT family protein [Bacillus paramycoides]MED1465778.1 YitT family protein [Bacillus paramycoides]MED1495474.1 YitT family protein [Bacillus paramycoides]
MVNQRVKEIALITIGSLLFAIGINYFAIPNRLSEGGIIGLTVVTYYLFDWSPGIVNFGLNAILLAVGYKFFDKKTMIYTIIGIVETSLFLYVTEHIQYQVNGDTLLAALFAGVFVGIGLGCMFKAGGTSGGSAILARLANQYLGWSVGKGVLIIDIVVIAGSVFIIGQEKAMYTLVAVFIGAKVIDFIVEGMDTKTAVTIISNQPDLIRETITNNMTRGVTVLEGRGGYTGKNKEVLYVVINKQELVKLKQVISRVDEDAFVVIHDVRDVLGGGFKAS